MRKTLVTGLVVAVGLVVLAGYAFQDHLMPITSMIVDWGILLLGFAMLLGIGTLVQTHLVKLFKAEKGASLSAVTLLAFFFTLISGLILTTQNPFFSDLIVNIQVPVEAGLLAVLAVILMVASLRLIRIRGWSPLSIGFLVSAVIALLFEAGIFNFAPESMGGVMLGFLRRLPIAGARGILLGMALGGLLIGLRMLLVTERPFGEK